MCEVEPLLRPARLYNVLAPPEEIETDSQIKLQRFSLAIDRGEGRFDKQKVLVLTLPRSNEHTLMPFSAFLATGQNTVHLSDVNIEGAEVTACLSGGYYLALETLENFYQPRHSRFKDSKVGDPIGWLMTNSQTIFPPIYSRATLMVSQEENGFFKYKIGRPDMTDMEITFTVGEESISFTPLGINKPDSAGVSCYTPLYQEKRTPQDNQQMNIALAGNQIVDIKRGGGLIIPINGCVISLPLPGELSEKDFAKQVAYALSQKGRDRWGNVLQAIEVGPELVKDGQPQAVDQEFLRSQGFTPRTLPLPAENSVYEHYKHLAPRMCLGIKANSDLVIALFEGRQPAKSLGVNLTEAGYLMASWLGCEQAMNLDGGGSAEIIYKGKQQNRPQVNKKGKMFASLAKPRHLLSHLGKRWDDSLPQVSLNEYDERGIGSFLVLVKKVFPAC